MKNVLISMVLLLFTLSAFAQGLEYNNLKLTSSPAYIILGVDPENIQRPSTPSEFTSVVQSAFVNGRLTPNFAVETSPAWWGKSKELQKKSAQNKEIFISEYLLAGKDDVGANWYGKNFARSLAISAATSESDTFTFGDMDRGMGFSVGIKMNLVHGHMSDKFIKNMIAYKANVANYLTWATLKQQLEGASDIAEMRQVLITQQGTLLASIQTSLLSNPYLYSEWNNNPRIQRSMLESLAINDSLNNYLALLNHPGGDTVLNSRLSSIVSNNLVNAGIILNNFNANTLEVNMAKEGFMLEFAAAGAWVVQDNRWNRVTPAKGSVWLTPSYRINLSKKTDDGSHYHALDIMGVVRATLNNKLVDSAQYFDFGAKFQYTYNKFSFSGEAVLRLATKAAYGVNKQYTDRIALSADYKINDYITLKATFGSNFDGNTAEYTKADKIFAVAGLNTGFFKVNKN
jgi:hypothetical protein